MIRANAVPDRQDQSSTHYVAVSIQDNCLIPCWHHHQTIRESVTSCIRGVEDTVKAFTDGRERPLTTEEWDAFRKALLELLLEARELASRDNTGAFSKCKFRELVSEESKRSRRSRRPLTIAYLDLDGFKRMNDTCGHRTGDKVLKIVAETMQSVLREMDSVSHLHGDEFALLLPETTGENAKVVADKLRAALRSAMKANGWKITFSIGVVTFRNPLSVPDYMIHEADKLMLSVKNTGKNRVAYLVLDGNALGFSTER